MKTEVYNLIILDESGSMSRVKRQTIDGCNETINTIIHSQKEFAETQSHYVSIFAFQSEGSHPSRYLVKNIPALEAHHIDDSQYEPYGMTPLYDAVGSTLAELKALTQTKELAIGSVTIITDGMENSSTTYTLQKVAKMISQLKELGWNFNFIGANIDVKATASALNIDNMLEFKQDEAGMRAMWEQERESRLCYNRRTDEAMRDMCFSVSEPSALPDEERKTLLSKLKAAGKNYFSK